MTQPIRLLIADDHGVLRAGLRALLDAESDMDVIAEAASGTDALHLATEHQPDVALLDLTMPGTGGIDVTRRLREQIPDLRILILTVHEDEMLLREAMRAGAAGYITKRAIESELINAVRTVHRGNHYVHPTMTHALLHDLTPEPPASTPTEALTPRETEVLQLIALGHTNRQAGEKLHISVRTVETHRANIMDKLNLRGRVELVSYARDHGFLDA
jgi:DNA-binding NarL/FixJ family response regulator